MTDIPEDDVPLTPSPDAEDDDDLTDITEDDVPLANVPDTGDYSLIWECLVLISDAGLSLLVLKNKKREENAE